MIRLYELDVENFIIYFPSVVRPFELWILSFSDWQNRILNRGWKDSKCIFSHGSWFWIQLGKMICYAALLRSTTLILVFYVCVTSQQLQKSNPLAEEEKVNRRFTGESRRRNIFQDQLRAERESFRAAFDKRKHRIGGLDGDEE